VVGTILLASGARSAYIKFVRFPERPIAQIRIPDTDWGRAMGWARATARDSNWLAHPAHAVQYGSSLRVAGERDLFVEGIKDAAIGMYERDVAIRTRDRLLEIDDYDNMTTGRARELAAKYGLDFMVSEAALSLPDRVLERLAACVPSTPVSMKTNESLHAQAPAAQRSPHDRVLLGKTRRFPRLPPPEDRYFDVATGVRVLAHCHWQQDRARTSGRARPARARELQQRTLHARARQQGVRARFQRRPVEPAELRRDRSVVRRSVPLRSDRRRRSRHPCDRARRHRSRGRRRLLAGGQPRAEARRRLRRLCAGRR
jgi:hypothetical protein